MAPKPRMPMSWRTWTAMVILFDLDDTLIDHTSAFLTGTRALHQHVASPLPLDAFVNSWSTAHRRYYDRYLRGEMSHDEHRRARTRDMMGAELTDAAADEIFTVYLEAYESAWALFPDVLPCLRRLTDHRLGVITNGQSAQQRRKLQHVGLDGTFDVVVVSSECACAKPDAAILQHACDQVGASPAHTLFVGDHYEIDVLGARNAGLTGVWLDRAGTATATHAAPILTSLRDLPELVVRSA